MGRKAGEKESMKRRKQEAEGESKLVRVQGTFSSLLSLLPLLAMHWLFTAASLVPVE